MVTKVLKFIEGEMMLFKRVSILFLLSAFFITMAYFLKYTLISLMAAFLLAYLALPVVQRLEKYKISRNWAVTAALVVGVLSLMGLLWALGPLLIKQMQLFFGELPGLIDNVLEYLKEKLPLSQFPAIEHLSKQDVASFVRGHAKDFLKDNINDGFGEFVLDVKTNLFILLQLVINVFLTPLLFYYVLENLESIYKEFKSWIPKSWKGGTFYHLVKDGQKVFQGYFRGQLITCLVLGVLYTIGFSIVGIKYSLLLGLGTGMFSFIPYVGFSLGLALTLISTFSQGATLYLLIGVFVVFLIVYFIESYYLVPKMVGNRVGLSPLESFLVLIIGGNIAGIKGLLFALPIAGIVKIILQEFKTYWLITWEESKN
jgi:predicted PurR-regulated permease PerM